MSFLKHFSLFPYYQESDWRIENQSFLSIGSREVKYSRLRPWTMQLCFKKGEFQRQGQSKFFLALPQWITTRCSCKNILEALYFRFWRNQVIEQKAVTKAEKIQSCIFIITFSKLFFLAFFQKFQKLPKNNVVFHLCSKKDFCKNKQFIEKSWFLSNKTLFLLQKNIEQKYLKICNGRFYGATSRLYYTSHQ